MTLKKYEEYLRAHDWNYEKQDAGIAYFRRENNYRNFLKNKAIELGSEFENLFNKYLKKSQNGI